MDALEPKSQEALDHEATEPRRGRSEPGNLRDQLAVREGQRQWATTERDYKSGRGNAERQYSELTPLIERAAPCGSLNPQFVEFLMNFPKDWTLLTE
jgi:hypothetical protein